jgi:hypothetical protein
VRLYLPAITLFAWAAGVIATVTLGLDPTYVRIGGPLVTGVATGIHIRDQIRAHKKREDRG